VSFTAEPPPLRPHRVLDTDVDEFAGDALQDGRLGGRIVAQDEERAGQGAAVEARLQPIFNVLRAPADQQRSGRLQNLLDC
jgi:hypothetical protein